MTVASNFMSDAILQQWHMADHTKNLIKTDYD